MYQVSLAYNRYHNGIVLLYETEIEAAGVAANLAKHGKPNEEGDPLLVIVSKVAEKPEAETPDD
jgi:hypothetical protein